MTAYQQTFTTTGLERSAIKILVLCAVLGEMVPKPYTILNCFEPHRPCAIKIKCVLFEKLTLNTLLELAA
ncbi:hypothetical protein V5799_034234 [Amblyomma americanum]|uniref:Uncharacterized protein n=1 Tax=Amblyomma americanum TaxID=6943 RepID=A0AAQ4DL17_AMBAM